MINCKQKKQITRAPEIDTLNWSLMCKGGGEDLLLVQATSACEEKLHYKMKNLKTWVSHFVGPVSSYFSAWDEYEKICSRRGIPRSSLFVALDREFTRSSGRSLVRWLSARRV